MTNILLVLTSVGTRADADRLARAVVEQRLAACVHIEAIDSVYRWNGAVQQEPEFRLLFKTTPERSAPLQAALREYQARLAQQSIRGLIGVVRHRHAPDVAPHLHRRHQQAPRKPPPSGHGTDRQWLDRRSLAGQQQGYGLGLGIVRDMVEAWGGSLSLEDSPLGGLRVAISLPGRR